MLRSFKKHIQIGLPDLEYVDLLLTLYTQESIAVSTLCRYTVSTKTDPESQTLIISRIKSPTLNRSPLLFKPPPLVIACIIELSGSRVPWLSSHPSAIGSGQFDLYWDALRSRWEVRWCLFLEPRQIGDIAKQIGVEKEKKVFQTVCGCLCEFILRVCVSVRQPLKFEFTLHVRVH